MRIKENLYEAKLATYFRQNIFVPSWTKWLAANSFGQLVAYKTMPRYVKSRDEYQERDTFACVVAHVDLEGMDIVDSLVEV